jgi:hypothetical protein
MNNEMNEVGMDIEVNLGAAVIRCIRQDWSARSRPWFRSRLKENIQALRFLRSHRLLARKVVSL